jgi:hypothetical protein
MLKDISYKSEGKVGIIRPWGWKFSLSLLLPTNYERFSQRQIPKIPSKLVEIPKISFWRPYPLKGYLLKVIQVLAYLNLVYILPKRDSLYLFILAPKILLIITRNDSSKSQTFIIPRPSKYVLNSMSIYATYTTTNKELLDSLLAAKAVKLSLLLPLTSYPYASLPALTPLPLPHCRYFFLCISVRARICFRMLIACYRVDCLRIKVRRLINA